MSQYQYNWYTEWYTDMLNVVHNMHNDLYSWQQIFLKTTTAENNNRTQFKTTKQSYRMVLLVALCYIVVTMTADTRQNGKSLCCSTITRKRLCCVYFLSTSFLRWSSDVGSPISRCRWSYIIFSTVARVSSSRSDNYSKDYSKNKRHV